MRRAFVLAFLLLTACRESEDPIVRTIDAIAEAAEDRDVDEVMQYVSTAYEGNRPEVEASLRRYFFAYQSFDVTISNLESHPSGDEAWVTFRVKLIGVPKTVGGLDQYLPRAADYRFEVSMRDEGGAWRVTAARWEELRGLN